MAAKESNMFQIKPPPTPPSTLNKELQGIWCAWSRMGDREVVREATAKGLHVDLAHTFLSARKELDSDATEKWFKDEVFVWISELLSRRQVFKASHILTNINVDSIKEFTHSFLTSYDKGLRDYLGNHLMKLEKLEPEYKISWNLLQMIEQNYDMLFNFDQDLKEFNVKYVYEQNFDWKCKIGTELYFKTYDPILKSFVTSENAWKFLLYTDNLELLRLWINIYFTKNTEFKSVHLNPQIYQQLTQMFLGFCINEEMLDLLTQKSLSEEIRENVLNELSKFGVFNKLERNDLICIVSRLAYNENIDSLHKILNQDISTVKLFDFNELLLDYCIKNEIYSVLNWCNIHLNLHKDLAEQLNSKYLNLMCYLRNNDLNSNIDVGENVLKISQFLSDDLKSYFVHNPLILIAILLILYKDSNLLELFKLNRSPIYIESFTVTPEIIAKVLNNLPFLHSVINRTNDQKITYHDLLKAHSNLDVNLFNYRLDNNIVPNFNVKTLVQNYGYNKVLSYIFYLKQLRPSFALKYCTENVNRSSVFHRIHKLTAHNFSNKEITAACIAFLEMIGENPETLRVYLRASNILYESKSFTLDEVQDLFENVVMNSEDFLYTLEKVLINDFSLQFDYSGVDLIEEIKKHEITVKFSNIHNLKLPELFLEHCAQNNLWLPFLLYIQTYNYPLNIIQKLLQQFSNPNLTEHLLHGLSQDIQIDDQRNLLMQERDSRKYYLSRIGVRKNVDNSSFDMVQSSVSSYGSYGSTESSSGSSDFLEIDNLDLNTDLLQTLIRCHNSIDPPKALLQACYLYKNPFFAVLATSYEPDSIITNWLTWLSVSCEIGNEFLNFEGATPNADFVADLLKCTLKKGYGKILQESFQIFLPENPLNIFVDFLNDCVKLCFDSSVATTKLSEFESELKQRKNSAIIMDIDYEMMYMTNKTWIETTACGLLATTIEYNFTSQYNQLKFLKFLHLIDISKYFSIHVPDFQKFYTVLNYLCKTKCDIKLDLSVIFNDEILEKELLSCVHELVFKKFYDCAFLIATIQGIDTDFIVINEWQDRFINNKREKGFWHICHHAFKTTEVSGKAAVDFFERCSEKTTDKKEKYKILNLARRWAMFFNLNNAYEVERKMWIAYFDIDATIIHCDFIKNKMLYAEMKQKLQSLENDCESDLSTLSEETLPHLNKTIEKLLSAGDLWQALRLAKIFKHETNDLEIIILCCNLAEGLLMPYQLDTEQRLLLNKNGNFRTLSHRRRRTLMSSRGFSSFSSGSHSPSVSTVIQLSDTVEAPFQDTLIALETLVERVKNGVEIVQNMLMTYRISVNIDKPYQEVFKCTNAMSMLKEALKDDCSNKLEVVHDFSVLFGWSKMQIADLLCEELITSISEHIKLKLEAIMLWNINLDTDFHLILQLLMENCSILGLKLYSYASALHKSQNQLNSDFRISEINLVIELLIRSHDCFTADCNMEGISTILRKCQSIITLLLTLKSWKLIVRLLTGVARYSEMNYVFHILRENDQFEFLLRKGSRKDNGLKVALLKYLKKYCPEERELYRMVALHFTLFSEIAQLWEEEARSIVRNLIAISKLEMQNNGLNVEGEPYVLLTNTDGTKICLNKAMVNYTHATEYHLQGEKLAKAMNSAKQAELLALQTSMLKGLASNSTAICILNLSDAQIFSLISTELSFSQSLVLVEAYTYKADWASVLFEQFVINNHWNYLDGFLTSFPLTDTLINDISRKFLNLKAISDTTTRNMKEIINKCASVRTIYRIASELGFSDLVEDLLAGNQLAFLKDTVWKKGYKS